MLLPLRRTSSRGNLVCLASLLLGLCAKTGHASTWGSGGDTVLDARPSDVCEAKTINYITHTLPQQCFRTAWKGPTPAPAPAPAPEAPGHGGDTTNHTESDATPSNSTEQHDATATKQTDGEREEDQKTDANEELATSSFMSFEEWKEMMLRKSGQDPANLKTRKDGHQATHRGGGGGGGGRLAGLSDGGIDAIGDDAEINFDFDALSEKVSELTGSSSSGDTGQGAAAPSEPMAAMQEEPVLYDNGMAYYYRSKDAGKTCKERFSYSSFDAGATVLKTSPGAKNAKALLVENKDSYMLLECHQKQKFVIVELSDDILVDTVVLANFEFFSSMIRKFKVSVSDRYPVKPDKWVHLGTFEAKNSRDIQAFLVEHPQIYTKYVRIEFLSHYGTEYYCPVSLLRVHGTRMLDSWKEPDNILEDDVEEVAMAPGTEPLPETSSTTAESPPAEPGSEPVAPEKTVAEAEAEAEVQLHAPQNETCPAQWHPFFYRHPSLDMCMVSWPTAAQPTAVSSDGTPQSLPSLGPEATAVEVDAHASVSPSVSESSSSALSVSVAGDASSSAVKPTKSTSISSTFTRPAASTATAPAPAPAPAREPAPHAAEATQASAATKPSSSASSPSPPTATQPSSTSRNKVSPAASAPPASPTVQESFFKAVNKRLQHLESNTSLSLQYIEEQSRFLQEALTKMEKKQIARVDAFLDALNKTVLTELRNVRNQYDQIWQSTVIALETQREQSAREVVALTGRLNVLADEVVFQKRMAILQSLLLLACLGLVMFSRGAPAFVSGFDFNGSQSQQQTPYRPAGAGILSSVMNMMGTESPPSTAGLDYTPTLVRTRSGTVLVPRRYPTPPSARRSASQQDTRPSQARPPSYHHDKVLPLTPTAEYGEHATPMVQIDEVDSDSPSFADEDKGTAAAAAAGERQTSSTSDSLLTPPHSQADGEEGDRDVPGSHATESRERESRSGASGLRSDTIDSSDPSDSRPMGPLSTHRELSPVPEQELEHDESQTPTVSAVDGLKSLPPLPDDSG